MLTLLLILLAGIIFFGTEWHDQPAIPNKMTGA